MTLMVIIGNRDRNIISLSVTSLVLLLGFALLSVISACGGGSDKPYQASAVTCDPLNGPPYKYTTQVALEVQEATSPIPGAHPAPNPFRLVQKVEGALRDLDKADATISAESAGSSGVPTHVIVVGNDVYTSTPGGPWSRQPLTNPGNGKVSNPVPYRPLTSCKAISQVIDPTTATGQPEKVNDIASHRFQVDLKDGKFFVQDTDFGGGSDAAHFVTQITGNVWVADDGAYVSKLDVTGTGTYPDGKKLIVTVAYEISEHGGDINIQAPT